MAAFGSKVGSCWGNGGPVPGSGGVMGPGPLKGKDHVFESNPVPELSFPYNPVPGFSHTFQQSRSLASAQGNWSAPAHLDYLISLLDTRSFHCFTWAPPDYLPLLNPIRIFFQSFLYISISPILIRF